MIENYKRYMNKDTVSKTALMALSDKIKQWRRDGVQVFVMRAPTSKRMIAFETERTGYSDDDFKRLFEKAGAHWISTGRDADYQTYDGDHLTYDEAERFSYKLAAKVKQLLAKD